MGSWNDIVTQITNLYQLVSLQISNDHFPKYVFQICRTNCSQIVTIWNFLLCNSTKNVAIETAVLSMRSATRRLENSY